MSVPQSPEKRAAILAGLKENRSQLDAILDDTERDPDGKGTTSEPEEEEDRLVPLLNQREKWQTDYLGMIPEIAVSRCPFTGAIVHKRIDLVGLDGPWWDYANPIRPQEAVPRTWLGMSGSLVVKAPFPALNQVVMPGPSVPVVFPGLLAEADVRAVLSSVQIGSYPGVVVSWFVRRDPHRFMPPNEWGAPWCDAPREDGTYIRVPSTWQLPDADTDLAPWIRRGKLFWISPGDTSLMLRADLDACPYLGMEGDGRLQYLVEGTLRQVGMTEEDIRKTSMTDEEFQAAMQLLRDEEEGED